MSTPSTKTQPSYTAGPWTIDDEFSQDIYGGDELLASVYPMKRDGIFRSWQANARLIAAAPDLLEAAKLTVLHFKRNQVSGNFQGDDEHEAWTALDAAISKAGLL